MTEADIKIIEEDPLQKMKDLSRGHLSQVHKVPVPLCMVNGTTKAYH